MSIERKTIRNTIKEIILGATQAGSNVHTSRTTPQKDDDLPAIHIYTNSEAGDRAADSPRSNFRFMATTFEVITKGLTGAIANDLADDICQEIEDIMDLEDQNANGVLGCQIEEAIVSGSDTELQPEGDAATCSVRLAYSIKYVKVANVKSAIDMAEAETLGVDWNVGTADDPDSEMQDLINLRP